MTIQGQISCLPEDLRPQPNQKLNYRLIQWLNNKDLTQQAFADSIDVSQSTVRNWVHGQSVRDVVQVISVCHVYNMAFCDVLCLLGHKIDSDFHIFPPTLETVAPSSVSPQQGDTK